MAQVCPRPNRRRRCLRRLGKNVEVEVVIVSRLLRMLRSIALALLLVLGLRSVPLVHAEDCQFILGFQTLHDLLGSIVGNCLDNEQHNPANGDGLQQTTGGLLVWRKADNFTAFTTGYRTFVNGPTGLETRLNTQRFAWEANPEGLPVAPDAYVGAAQFQHRPGPTLQFAPSGLSGSGPLRFQVTGTGFPPGEALTLQGTYTPTFGLPTGNPSAPFTTQMCLPQALGPVQAAADSAGTFTATLQAAVNFHVPTATRITVTGPVSGTLLTGSGGGTLPQLGAILPGCQ
jgi:hypothetical protein